MKVGSQEITGVTGKSGLGVQNEAGQKLIDFCQENTLVTANTLFQQHKRTLHMDITRWSILKSELLYSPHQKMERLYSQQKQDLELTLAQLISLIAKFRLKLKTIAKITRQFRYDVNQSPDDYTVEVMDRFKVLDLVVRVPEEL